MLPAHKWILLCISGFLLLIIIQIAISPYHNRINQEITKNDIQQENIPKPRDYTNYAVVFDLGSSGSRANIFTFNYNKYSHCAITSGGAFEDLKALDGGTKKIKPGVGNLVKNPELIGNSLSNLWTFLDDNIPVFYRRNTPIFMFATAGLRVIAEQNEERLYDDDELDDNVILEVDDDDYGIGSVDKILIHLRNYIRDNTEFKLIRDDHIRVLMGHEEGLFDFLTIQQLLKNNIFASLSSSSNDWSEPIFNPPETSNVDLYSICSIDLGGASTQYSAIPLTSIVDKFDTIDIKEFTLSPYRNSYPKVFTHSFLDYGINRAREIYYNRLIELTKDIHVDIIDPCGFIGHDIIITHDNINYNIIGSSNYIQCKTMITDLFTEYRGDRNCSNSLCTMTDVGLPKISRSTQIIAFDHAYRIASLLSIKGYGYISDLFKNSKEVFSLTWENAENLFPSLNDEELEKFLFESLYVPSLLQQGYRLGLTTKIGFADKIDNQSLSWALGALVHNLFILCEQDLF